MYNVFGHIARFHWYQKEKMFISADVIDNIVFPYVPLDLLYSLQKQDSTGYWRQVFNRQTKDRLNTLEPMTVAIVNDDLELYRCLLPLTNPQIFDNALTTKYPCFCPFLEDPQDPEDRLRLQYRAYSVLAVDNNAREIIKDIVPKYDEFCGDYNISRTKGFYLGEAILQDPELEHIFADNIPWLFYDDFFEEYPERLVDYLQFIKDRNIDIPEADPVWTDLLPSEGGSNLREDILVILANIPNFDKYLQSIWGNTNFEQMLLNSLLEINRLRVQPEEIVEAFREVKQDPRRSSYTYYMLPLLAYSSQYKQ